MNVQESPFARGPPCLFPTHPSQPEDPPNFPQSCQKDTPEPQPKPKQATVGELFWNFWKKLTLEEEDDSGELYGWHWDEKIEKSGGGTCAVKVHWRKTEGAEFVKVKTCRDDDDWEDIFFDDQIGKCPRQLKECILEERRNAQANGTAALLERTCSRRGAIRSTSQEFLDRTVTGGEWQLPSPWANHLLPKHSPDTQTTALPPGLSVCQSGCFPTPPPGELPFRMDIHYSELDKIEWIGKGGFGLVFSAWYMGRKVAVKIVHDLYYTNKSVGGSFIKALKEELLLTRKLGAKCSHIVPCYGGCIVEPHVCLVSKLMSRTLGVFIHDTGPLPIGLALRITKDILIGLNCLHTMQPEGIVHRDIKPSNVLLDEHCRASLTDFGLSRLKPKSAYIDTSHPDGGTAHYLSPEVLAGKVSFPMDIYAVGMVMFQQITGQQPWAQTLPGCAILHNVGKGDRPELCVEFFPATREGNPGMYGVKQLIERCWDGDYMARPTAREAIQIIDELQEQFPDLKKGRDFGFDRGSS